MRSNRCQFPISRTAVLGCLAILLAVPFSGASVAQERDATASESRKVIRHLRALGYRSITDVDVVGNRFEVDAISPRGDDVDVVLDRRTLRVIRVRSS